MDIESMANYADVIGGAAVILSLIYVGVQIRQSVTSSLAQTNQLAHKSLAIVSLEVAKDADLASLLEKGLEHFADYRGQTTISPSDVRRERWSVPDRFGPRSVRDRLRRERWSVPDRFEKGGLSPIGWFGIKLDASFDSLKRMDSR